MLYIKDTNENKSFYATEDAIGFDIRADADGYLNPGEFKVIPTGLYMDVGFNSEVDVLGYELQVRPRSGLAAKYGVTVLNSPGTVDPLYPDEIGVILINHGQRPFSISKGDRIAQGVVARVSRAQGIETKDNKRTGGFGSTGTK